MEAKTERELTLEMQQGQRSEQILKDPLVLAALRDMRVAYYSGIERSKMEQSEEREHCYRMLKAIKAFEDQFKARVSMGKRAQSKLEMLKTKIKQLRK